MSAVDDYREAQVAEWGRYVAAEPIFVGGARAFNAGDPVPVSHVENGVVSESQVREVAPAKASRTRAVAPAKASRTRASNTSESEG